MRSLPSMFMAVVTCCALIQAQEPRDAGAKKPAGKATAADRFKELGDQQTERVKELRASTRGADREAVMAANKEMMAARAKDLEAFLGEFPQSPESTKARLEIAGMSIQNKDLADAAKKALADLDVKDADMKTTAQAAALAARIGLEEKKTLWLDAASTKAKSIEDRLELASSLGAMKETERAEKLMAEVEKSAKTDEERGTILLHKATNLRRTNRDDKQGYQDALAEVAKLYPATKSGKLAAGKIQAAGLKPGSDPVAFTAKDLNGKTVTLADYKGKVLLVDFWAMWCGPCLAELPHVTELYEKHHDKGFEILGISLDRENEKEKLEKFLKEKNMPWQQIYDGKYWSAEIAQIYDVQGIPFTVLIGKDGKVVGTGLRTQKNPRKPDEPTLGEMVEKALAEN